MKKRLLFILCLSLITVSTVAAQQKRTVTNLDLDKFRQKREAADKDYRENYERMGFPSPEELDKQRTESLRRMQELSEKLRGERLERERADAIRSEMNSLQAYSNYLQSAGNDYQGFQQGYYSGYAPYGYQNFRRAQQLQPQGFFAGGMFISSPTRISRPPRPIRAPVTNRPSPAPRRIGGAGRRN